MDAEPRVSFVIVFDHLRNIVLNLDQKLDEFLDALHFLSCT